LPNELKSVGVDEHMGAQLDLSNEFTADDGVTAPLGRFFGGHKPVLMAMVYYNCPSLCSYHLNSINDTLKQLKWTSGEQFELVAVSMDHHETPDLAAKKKQSYVKAYGRPEGEKGWHFLVGKEANVKKLADQLGFRFQWMPEKKQFAHAAVAYVITPDGKISRYLHGLGTDAQTMKFSLLEASNGKIGSIVEQVLMFCFQFDPKKSKYTLYAWNVMRLGGILMVLMLAVVLVPLWKRDMRRMSS
jgi:protein SCO1/2